MERDSTSTCESSPRDVSELPTAPDRSGGGGVPRPPPLTIVGGGMVLTVGDDAPDPELTSSPSSLKLSRKDSMAIGELIKFLSKVPGLKAENCRLFAQKFFDTDCTTVSRLQRKAKIEKEFLKYCTEIGIDEFNAHDIFQDLDRSSKFVESVSEKGRQLSEADADLTDCFLTHNWGANEDNHKIVSRINGGLVTRGLKTWFDEEKIKTQVRHAMAKGIDETQVVVCFITSQYRDKVNSGMTTDHCCFEFDYALDQKTNQKMIAVVLEQGMRNPKLWRGSLGGALAGQVYLDMTDHEDPDKFEEKCDKLKKLIVQVRDGNAVSRLSDLAADALPSPGGGAAAGASVSVSASAASATPNSELKARGRELLALVSAEYPVISRIKELCEKYKDKALALDYQAEKQDLKSIRALVEYNLREYSTPLMVACALGRKDIVQVLLANGANCTKSDSECHTALHFCATFTRFNKTKMPLECLELILAQKDASGKLKARVNAFTDDNQETPLFRAVRSDNVRAVAVLLKHGADMDLRNSASQHCKEFASSEVKAILTQHAKTKKTHVPSTPRSDAKRDRCVIM